MGMQSDCVLFQKTLQRMDESSVRMENLLKKMESILMAWMDKEVDDTQTESIDSNSDFVEIEAIKNGEPERDDVCMGDHTHEILDVAVDPMVIIEKNPALMKDEVMLLPQVYASDTPTPPITSKRMQTDDALLANFSNDVLLIAALLISHARAHVFVMAVKERIMVKGFMRLMWLVPWLPSNLWASSFEEGEDDADQDDNNYLY